ncbi:MAG: FHA domain-containing protein [Woeseiaceae bacterium]|nr:FHA domain-containing protein [Woeseiaceae bacterium]
MKYLIRFVTKNAAGGTEHADKIVDAAAVTIGRATDQVLQLRDKRARLQHASIERQADGVHIVATAVTGVVVNGRSRRDVKLDVGDVIEVGSNILRIVEAPAGIDFALTFELSETASTDHFVTDWSELVPGIGKWSKRRLSWALVMLVVAGALIVPGISIVKPVSTDAFWLAGPLHNAHSSVANDCGACHINVFQRVPDQACTECHDAARHVAPPGEAVLGEIRCASCHLEHNEPAELVNRHQGLCADCHADPPAESGLQPAADFLDAHPEFKLSLLQPSQTEDGDFEWSVEHLPMSIAAGAEQSNLKFDHAAHLDEQGIVTPDGRRVIECAECHEPEPGGARMKPIVMDEHCSDCHTLSFDPDFPSREVPHGDPLEVMQALIEYYSARLLGADPDAVEQRVRRPGRRLSRADRDRAAAEARVQAMQVAGDLFERRACATCHDVSRDEGNRDAPWRVRPVRLTETFFVHANFTHAAHQTEVTNCESCHEASASSSARDVLIPGIDNCRECHGSGFSGRNTAAQTPSTCIMCHGFHFEVRGKLGEEALE